MDQVVHSLQPLTLSMCVRFRIAQRRRRLAYCNDYFSVDDALFDLTEASALVDAYDFSPLTLQDVAVQTRLTRGVKDDVLLRASAPRRVRPGQRIPVRLVLRRRGSGGNRRLSFRMRLPRSLRPGRRAMVLDGTGGGGGSALEELTSALVTLFGGDGADVDAGGGGPQAHSIDQLGRAVAAFHRGQGLRARFRHRGKRMLVYENGSVAFSGSIRIPLRVVRRRR